MVAAGSRIVSSFMTRLAALSGRQPARTLGAELRLRACLVGSGVIVRECVHPAPVHALVNKDLRAGVPRTRRPVEHCGVAFFFIQSNEQCLTIASHRASSIGISRKACNSADLSGHVALEVRKVHKPYIWKMANFPPTPHIFPERPEGMSILRQPVLPVLLDVVRRRLDRGTDLDLVCRSGLPYQTLLAFEWWLYMLQTTSRPSRPM